jgi:hypothetical protein
MVGQAINVTGGDPIPEFVSFFFDRLMIEFRHEFA